MATLTLLAGNHDVRGSVEAQLQLHDREPHWNMPARYYAKIIEAGGVSVLFVFLDTNLMLESTLAELEARRSCCKLVWAWTEPSGCGRAAAGVA